MSRSFLVGWLCSIFVLLSDVSRACPVLTPTREALVDVGLSSIRTALAVSIYALEETYCDAVLALKLSTLPSRSVVPRPRELASELAPAAKAFGAKSCEITVWVGDDTDADFTDGDEECYRGQFRFDGASWRAVEDDEPCW
jgi:hypothetical protein